MRILITNDDGINAPGLDVLHTIATDIAGPGGEVWTVAPAFEQSGVGHCISYTHPTMISEFGPRRFAAEGSPADCVLAGLHDVLKDTPPDLILSGVNKGNNSAENTLYSGTIGAAIEAAIQGLPSIALSQYYGPGNISLDNPFEAASAHGADVIRKILAAPGAFESHPYKLFYNVNFPPVAAADVKGIRAVGQGFREGGTGMGMRADMAPNGRKFLWITGSPQNVPSGADTDATVNIDGYISVTPMRADLTAYDQLQSLKDAIE
ncbi:5'/3'-nucleotidase SurE [Jannaschia sp. CCS1]|uniref:5'-nucleotidase SurE n=1 Tax=Jannaschia sp. (strain CCS1) TaxID=290400 RepID=SURE_JANSC|nr:5'/3'-nucleotidase SurE [Jannaschia sp. CCS1]Q28TH7.1 RecName: Full=5'-nucleotidase SurE; AltName: Full=Nucleoside 5'-monophosphate phosphohydrolase [Jannaschia sp. CCS1]ABD53985.1 exopolyphosphatase / 3'-nucleotidase / 5'-nucleotidase [Jannaschia sp. CCS1]